MAPQRRTKPAEAEVVGPRAAVWAVELKQSSNSTASMQIINGERAHYKNPCGSWLPAQISGLHPRIS